MARRQIAALCLAFVLAFIHFSVGMAEEQPEPPRQYFILDAEFGPDLVKQCSRAAPQDVESFFRPTDAMVIEAETALKEYFSEPVPKSPTYNPELKWQVDLSKYTRQYVGYQKSDQKFLYINAIPGRRPPEIATKPVTACHGGTRFWGAAWSQDEKQIIHFAWNG